MNSLKKIILKLNEIEKQNNDKEYKENSEVQSKCETPYQKI